MLAQPVAATSSDTLVGVRVNVRLAQLSRTPSSSSSLPSLASPILPKRPRPAVRKWPSPQPRPGARLAMARSQLVSRSTSILSGRRRGSPLGARILLGRKRFRLGGTPPASSDKSAEQSLRGGGRGGLARHAGFKSVGILRGAGKGRRGERRDSEGTGPAGGRSVSVLGTAGVEDVTHAEILLQRRRSSLDANTGIALPGKQSSRRDSAASNATASTTDLLPSSGSFLLSFFSLAPFLSSISQFLFTKHIN